MMRVLGTLALIAVPAGRGVRAENPVPEFGRLKTYVETLAAPAFEGRRGEGARKAEHYIVEELRSFGLKPLFGHSFTQDVPGKQPGQVIGRNVGARLEGIDPNLRDEWLILSAHYDHLGVRNGVLYPGADDNASGVAMLLEVARSFARAEGKPRRSVMFVAFDLEENGLFGSRYFADQPPVPMDKIALFLTADLIGGSLGGVCDSYVFVLGSEHAPDLRQWISVAGKGLPLQVGVLGSDVLLINRSDYGPFRARKIPYLFFSTGESPRYHTPEDKPETVDYRKLLSISNLIHRVVQEAVCADALPKWSSTADNPLAEAVVVRDVMSTLLTHRDDLKIKAGMVAIMERTVRQLDAIIARGTMTAGERRSMVLVAQLVLSSVL
jgi:Zn-dependent M28 family amino/carboxypeptidase